MRFDVETFLGTNGSFSSVELRNGRAACWRMEDQRVVFENVEYRDPVVARESLRDWNFQKGVAGAVRHLSEPPVRMTADPNVPNYLAPQYPGEEYDMLVLEHRSCWPLLREHAAVATNNLKGWAEVTANFTNSSGIGASVVNGSWSSFDDYLDHYIMGHYDFGNLTWLFEGERKLLGLSCWIQGNERGRSFAGAAGPKNPVQRRQLQASGGGTGGGAGMGGGDPGMGGEANMGGEATMGPGGAAWLSSLAGGPAAASAHSETGHARGAASTSPAPRGTHNARIYFYGSWPCAPARQNCYCDDEKCHSPRHLDCCLKCWKPERIDPGCGWRDRVQSRFGPCGFGAVEQAATVAGGPAPGGPKPAAANRVVEQVAACTYAVTKDSTHGSGYMIHGISLPPLSSPPPPPHLPPSLRPPTPPRLYDSYMIHVPTTMTNVSLCYSRLAPPVRGNSAAPTCSRATPNLSLRTGSI